MKLFLTMFSLVAFCGVSDARPVSYAGGWTVMLSNDGHSNSAHVHYSPTPKTSIGARSEYMRGADYYVNSIQMNNLIQRWNHKNSQANFYLKSGLGVAYSDAGDFDGETAPAGFTGIALDWENRRYFTSYENRMIDAGDIDRMFMQSARVGVAPYIGDYGDLHTWFMVQLDHAPQSDAHVTLTPLLRVFKGSHLVETGVSNQGDVLFNYIKRF